MRYSRVHRLLKIITLIQSGSHWNARELARECSTTLRTIYRDLNMLEGAGIPYFHDAESGCYRIQRDFFMQPIELTLEEALAILCLADRVGDDDQIPFMKPAAQAAAKIRGQLPAAMCEELERVDPHVEIRLSQAMPPDGTTDVYQLVRAAIGRRRALLCRYESPPGRKDSTSPTPTKPAHAGGGNGTHNGHGNHSQEFAFKPYCLWFCQRAWYVVGHHGGHQAVRNLKLNRFSDMRPTQQPYAIPEDFSLKRYLGKAWRMIPDDRTYRVELHFDPTFAETVADTHWHDTQEIEYLDDGSILFRCEVSGLREIVWWILSMGPHCTVNKPKVLADWVKKLAQDTAKQYRAKSQKSTRRR